MKITSHLLLGKNTLFECVCNKALLKIVIFTQNTAVMIMSNRYTLLGIHLIGRVHKTIDHFCFLGTTNLLVSELRYYFLTSVTAANHHYQCSYLNSPIKFYLYNI